MCIHLINPQVLLMEPFVFGSHSTMAHHMTVTRGLWLGKAAFFLKLHVSTPHV